jgi:hypothetical protein
MRSFCILEIHMSHRVHISPPSAVTTEAARKLRRMSEMLAGLVDQPDSSRPTMLNRETFMPTDFDG